MADAYTTTASVNSVQAAYERLAYFALRPNLFFDRAADVKPNNLTHEGSSVKFTLYTDLAPATTPLAEAVDVDAVAISDAVVTVTPTEHGNAVVTTAKLRGTSYLNVDADAANLVGYNAGISIDTLARTPLFAGTNVFYGGAVASRVTVAAGTIITAAKVRQARAALVNANVQPFEDGLYRAYIHPDVAYDLRSETGQGSWRQPHEYSAPGEIWNGSIGAFEGFEFIETPRGGMIANAGVGGTVDVYQTLFIGRQGLAKTWSKAVSAPLPQIVRGEVTDKLRRFHPIGWYWFGGYGIFRQEAIRRLETSSSIGANT